MSGTVYWSLIQDVLTTQICIDKEGLEVKYHSQEVRLPTLQRMALRSPHRTGRLLNEYFMTLSYFGVFWGTCI